MSNNWWSMDAILAEIKESLLRDDVYRGEGSRNTSRGGVSLHKLMQHLRLQVNGMQLAARWGEGIETRLASQGLLAEIGGYVVDEIEREG